MVIGIVTFECIIHDAQSLKDKRAVLQRTLTRLKQKYNVTVAEIDYQNVWQRTKIAFAVITSSRQATEAEINEALRFIDSFPEWERTLTEIEWG